MALSIGVLASCTKTRNRSINYNTVIQSSRAYASVQQMTVRLMNTFYKMATDSLVLHTGYNPDVDGAVCRYRKDTITDSVFYSMTYGSWGVIDPFHRRRGGEIVVELDGNLNDSLTKGAFFFHQFHYDFDTLKATEFSIQNRGTDAMHQTLFHVSAHQMRWQIDSTQVIVWNFNQNYLRQKGGNSAYFSKDDQYLISGTLDGTTTNGTSFQTTVNAGNELNDNYHCAWLTTGTVLMSIQGFESAQLLFPPQGSCISRYQLWISGNRFDNPIEYY